MKGSPLVAVLPLSVAFAAIAWSIHDGGKAPGDVALLSDLHRHSTRVVESLARWTTHLGDVGTVALLALTIAAVLAWRQRRRDGLALLTSVVGAGVAAAVFKQIFERQRPHLFSWLISEGGYSFPSGHSTGSMALALAVAVTFWKNRHGTLIGVAAIGAAVIVAASRLELGVHYPSDVLAGWLVAAASVTVVTWVNRDTRFASRFAPVCEDGPRVAAATTAKESRNARPGR